MDHEYLGSFKLDRYQTIFGDVMALIHVVMFVSLSPNLDYQAT
jgi:hypothetical protein